MSARTSRGSREAALGPQALLWFGIAGGALALGFSLLYERFVRRESRAVRSRGGFTLFAFFMLLFAAGAALAGLASVGVGR
jgi:hypothetical protein